MSAVLNYQHNPFILGIHIMKGGMIYGFKNVIQIIVKSKSQSVWIDVYSENIMDQILHMYAEDL